jgi:lysophospholipase L1-like esterase
VTGLGPVRTALLMAFITLALGVLVGIGYIAGRYAASAPVRQLLQAAERVETLGGLLAVPGISSGLSERQQRGYSLVYDDSAKIEAEIIRTPWAGRITYTPFVNSAQWPDVRYQIDAMQFRANRALSVPKPARTYRIFLTGGSTAYGSGVPTYAQTIGGYLETAIDDKSSSGLRYEVITAANPAWSSTHERILIENRLAELEPDLVISLSGNNDVFWGHAGKNIFWFHDYVSGLYLRLLNEAFALAGREPMPDVTVDAPAPVAPMIVAARLVKNARLAAYALKIQAVPYVFVLQPTLAVTRKALTAREREFLEQQNYYRESYARIDEQLSRGGEFYYIDLAGVFDDRRADEEIFLDSFHFGDRGNRLIAHALLRRLRDARLLPEG